MRYSLVKRDDDLCVYVINWAGRVLPSRPAHAPLQFHQRKQNKWGLSAIDEKWERKCTLWIDRYVLSCVLEMPKKYCHATFTQTSKIPLSRNEIASVKNSVPFFFFLFFYRLFFFSLSIVFPSSSIFTIRSRLAGRAPRNFSSLSSFLAFSHFLSDHENP